MPAFMCVYTYIVCFVLYFLLGVLIIKDLLSVHSFLLDGTFYYVKDCPAEVNFPQLESHQSKGKHAIIQRN